MREPPWPFLHTHLTVCEGGAVYKVGVDERKQAGAGRRTGVRAHGCGGTGAALVRGASQVQKLVPGRQGTSGC